MIFFSKIYKLKKSNARSDLDIGARDAEISQARNEIQDLITEYQELYDIKIQLDIEISAYRKLLESEEQRLNISSSLNGASNIVGASLCGSFLAGDDTSLRSGKKRRITAADDEAPSYLQTDQTTCDVKMTS